MNSFIVPNAIRYEFNPILIGKKSLNEIIIQYIKEKKEKKRPRNARPFSGINTPNNRVPSQTIPV